MNEIKSLTLLKRIISYFPIRFMLCGLFFSCVILSNSYLPTLENQILLGLLQFFRVPAYIDGDLFAGNFESPTDFSTQIHTQSLFLIFFPSLAVATRSTFDVRIRILIFGVLCFLGFMLTEFLTIVTMLGLGIASQIGFTQASIILTSIVACATIEALLFSTIKLPKRTRVSVIIKRSYFYEYLYLAVLLLASTLLVYFVTTYLNLHTNSVVTAYLALSVSSILFFRYYISYFIYEAKMPRWAQRIRSPHTTQLNNMPISFLLPAYNEEKHIRRCIESIDKAASRYTGYTEIVVVNDGSTDNTRKIASEAILNLKHANGKVFNIPNSGKGFALQYGLKRLTGDVVFRIDGDSALGENSIGPIMNHFKDPQVGSVSGLIFPLEEKSWWQKVWVLQFFLLSFYRREWELTDSVLLQPGAFSIFRKDALMKVGGWVDHQLGEDGEITVRLGRCGYRNEYEQNAIAYSEAPANLAELREQRVRWAMAFYHSRAANLNVVKEFNGPLAIIYLLALWRTAAQLAGALFVPFLIAEFILGSTFSLWDIAAVLGISAGLLTIELLTYGLDFLVNIYFLFKFKKLYLVKYIPLVRLYELIYSMFIEPEAVEILLSVSSKWKEHTKELTSALRKKIQETI